jgi:hypothetical protein
MDNEAIPMAPQEQHPFRPTRRSVRRLTDAEVAAALAAMKQAQHFREAMQAQHGGRVLPESWPDIRAAREERADRV